MAGFLIRSQGARAGVAPPISRRCHDLALRSRLSVLGRTGRMNPRWLCCGRL